MITIMKANFRWIPTTVRHVLCTWIISMKSRHMCSEGGLMVGQVVHTMFKSVDSETGFRSRLCFLLAVKSWLRFLICNSWMPVLSVPLRDDED